MNQDQLDILLRKKVSELSKFEINYITAKAIEKRRLCSATFPYLRELVLQLTDEGKTQSAHQIYSKLCNIGKEVEQYVLEDQDPE